MPSVKQILMDSSNLNQLADVLVCLCYEVLGEHRRDDLVTDVPVTPRYVANAVLGVFLRNDRIDYRWLKDSIIPNELSPEQRRGLKSAIDEFCEFSEGYGDTLVLRYGLSEPLRVRHTVSSLKELFAS